MHKVPDTVPRAVRIAEILRTTDPPSIANAYGEHSVDLAQRFVNKQRQQLGINTIPPRPTLLCQDVWGYGGIVGDTKVCHLADNVAHQFAEMQRRNDSDRENLERKLDTLSVRLDTRLGGLEARATMCEERSALQDRRIDGGMVNERAATETAAAISEVRASMANAFAEKEANGRKMHLELKAQQRETLRQLEDLAACIRRIASRADELERGAALQEEDWMRLGEQLKPVFDGYSAGPAVLAQELESAIESVEMRINEQQVDVDIQIGRLRAEVVGHRWRRPTVGTAFEDAFCEAQDVIDLDACGFSAQNAGATSETTREHARRLEDVEARVASLRVRVDAHEGRFTGFGDRLEAVCGSAMDNAKQFAAERCQEILSEGNCQVKLLRQRLDSLSEMWEESVMRTELTND